MASTTYAGCTADSVVIFSNDADSSEYARYVSAGHVPLQPVSDFQDILPGVLSVHAIEQAMPPGFPRAPKWAQGLGFGTGMGLPNFQIWADEMRLESGVGIGTYLEIVIYTW